MGIRLPTSSIARTSNMDMGGRQLEEQLWATWDVTGEVNREPWLITG